MQFNEIWKIYQESVLAEATYSAKVDIARYNIHIDSAIGSKDLSQITALDYYALRTALQKGGLAPQTIHHCLSLVRRILNFAKNVGVIDSFPPIGKNVLPKFDNKRNRFLSQEEAKRLLQELEGSDWYDTVSFALNTGLRAGEIFFLRSEHIDCCSRFANITDTKTRKNRAVPLNDLAYDIVDRRIRSNTDFLFEKKHQSNWQMQ